MRQSGHCRGLRSLPGCMVLGHFHIKRCWISWGFRSIPTVARL